MYILDDDKVVPALLHIDQRTDLLAKINGFNVVAPGWKRCVECPQLPEELHLEKFVSQINLGERVDFSPTGTRRAGGTCAIDIVNDKPRSQNPISVSGYLAVYGWAAIDPKNGVLPDAVVVVLKGPDGSEKFALAVRNPREDVAKFYGQAKLRDAGFVLKADITTLKGAYEIGVMQTFEGKTYACNVRQQLNVS